MPRGRLLKKGPAMSTSGAVGGHVSVAVVIGSSAFALTLLLAAAAGLAISAGLLLAASAGAALIAVWLARQTKSVRSAWGRGCLVNGLLSAAVAVGFRVQDDSWAGPSRYLEDLDRAIGPLTPFLWALAARIGLIALVLATILFALSYWLLGPPHRKA